MKGTIRILLLLLVMSSVCGTAIASPGNDYETARKYYFSGKYEEAVRHLEKYIEQKPDASAYYLMGYALYELKRFDEANEYFSGAYLIDPVYSPLPPSEMSERETKTAKARPKPAPVAQAAEATEPAKTEQAGPAAAAPGTPTAVVPPSEAPKPQARQMPSPEVAPSAPAAPQPPVAIPPMPLPRQSVPPGMDGAGGLAQWIESLFAGFALVFLGISLAFYLFFSYCLYRIAVRLNCPAAWTAWVPLLNIWPVVGSAGKPWWWLILLFIPLVGTIIWVYLWMCIAENLGKNKWVALLLQITVIGYLVLYPWLAFAKAEEAAPLPEPVELE